MHIRSFHVEFPSQPGLVLKIGFRVHADLSPAWYSFDLRRGATLLWRLDMHPGHEQEHGTLCHLHIGPEEGNRFPSEQVALLDVSDRLHDTLRSSDAVSGTDGAIF